MEVKYIKCDICNKRTDNFNSYFVETSILERQNFRYDICNLCEEKINKLIEEIQENDENLPF